MLEAFLAAVPEVELPLHLVGSAPPSTVARFAEEHPDAGVPGEVQPTVAHALAAPGGSGS